MEENRLFTLADELKAAKDKKKELEDEVKELGIKVSCLDRELSAEMAESECEKFSRNGSTFYLNTRLFASPAPGQKAELYQALKDNGYGELVTETVNANTLSSFCKELLQQNIEDDEAEGEPELPEWLKDKVITVNKVTVGIRKS